MQLVFKLWYLFYFSAASCLHPFLNVLFRRQASLTEAQIGSIAALRPWVSLPCGAAFSGIADKWRVHRAVVLVTFTVSAACRLSVSVVSSYGAILAIMLVAGGISSPVTILVDSAAVACFPEEGEYARQRLYGAVGWGTFSFIAGWMIQHAGSRSAFAINAVLSLCTLWPTLLLPWGPLHAKLYQHNSDHRDGAGGKEESGEKVEAAHGVRSGEAAAAAEEDEGEGLMVGEQGGGSSSSSPQQQQQQQQRVHFFRGVATLLTLPEAWVFFTQVTVMGYAVGTIEGFLFLFLEDLGGSETLMGLTLSVTCMAETCVFWWTGAITRALGLDGCLHLCFLAFLLRLGSYTTLSRWPGTPWTVLPVELLHGFTFGLTWAAGTAKCAAIAPPGLEATTQSAFQGLMFGLGHGSGGFVAGRIYHSRGPQTLFASAFVVVAVGWVVTGAAQAAVKAWWRPRLERKLSVVDGGGSYRAVEMVEH